MGQLIKGGGILQDLQNVHALMGDHAHSLSVSHAGSQQRQIRQKIMVLLPRSEIIKSPDVLCVSWTIMVL